MTNQQTAIVYASEADVLNVALFGKTAKEWREQYTEKKGNIRDYATVNELLLSVDVFHQETIPLEPVKYFAECVVKSKIHIKLTINWFCVLKNSSIPIW